MTSTSVTRGTVQAGRVLSTVASYVVVVGVVLLLLANSAAAAPAVRLSVQDGVSALQAGVTTWVDVFVEGLEGAHAVRFTVTAQPEGAVEATAVRPGAWLDADAERVVARADGGSLPTDAHPARRALPLSLAWSGGTRVESGGALAHVQLRVRPHCAGPVRVLVTDVALSSTAGAMRLAPAEVALSCPGEGARVEPRHEALRDGGATAIPLVLSGSRGALTAMALDVEIAGGAQASWPTTIEASATTELRERLSVEGRRLDDRVVRVVVFSNDGSAVPDGVVALVSSPIGRGGQAVRLRTTCRSASDVAAEPFPLVGGEAEVRLVGPTSR